MCTPTHRNERETIKDNNSPSDEESEMEGNTFNPQI